MTGRFSPVKLIPTYNRKTPVDNLVIPFITNRLNHWQTRMSTSQRLEETAREALQAAALHLATLAASGEPISLASREVSNHTRMIVHYERVIQQCGRRVDHYTDRLQIEMADMSI